MWNHSIAFYFIWQGVESKEVPNPSEGPVGRKWRVLEVTYLPGWHAGHLQGAKLIRGLKTHFETPRL